MGKPLDPDSFRARKAAAHKQQILDVARDLFQTHGYEVITCRMIGKAAKCSTGAMFGHWPDGKAELFKAAMGREPITDRVGVAYLAALYEIRRCIQAGALAEVPGVIARTDLS